MGRARQRHVAVRLTDCRVLVAGGVVPGDPSYTSVVSPTAEVFRPGELGGRGGSSPD
jgi:hypothetical protein